MLQAADVTLNAIAGSGAYVNYTNSPVTSERFNVLRSAIPVVTPASNVYHSPVTVTMTDAPGPNVYYTETPLAVYEASGIALPNPSLTPCTLVSGVCTTTVSVPTAIAAITGGTVSGVVFNPSAAVVRLYNVVALPPSILPAEVLVAPGTVVTIADRSDSATATIYYTETINGGTPTTGQCTTGTPISCQLTLSGPAGTVIVINAQSSFDSALTSASGVVVGKYQLN
jgi:hypothetical protein